MTAYTDFKSFLQANYIELITKSISEFVNESYDGIGFHSINVFSLCEQKIENPVIFSLKCSEEMIDLISIDASVSADVVTLGLGSKPYECDRKSCYFIVHMQAEINKGFHDLVVKGVEKYYKPRFEREGALDEFLVPYISAEDLENESDLFCEIYCMDEDYEDSLQFPYKKVMQRMGLQAFDAPLPDSEFGRIYFRPTEAVVYSENPKSRRLSVCTEKVPSGTILINLNHFLFDDYGNELTTIAHELIHWDKHKHFFELLDILNIAKDKISCAVTPSLTDEGLTGAQRALWWAEWQANTLAPRILMPRKLFSSTFKKIHQELLGTHGFTQGQIMEQTIDAVAKTFGVSRYMAKTRAIQLGFDDADSAFITIKGHHYPSMSHRRDSLQKNQTFIISEEDLNEILKQDLEFRCLVHAEAFVYTGCVLCINDEKFVQQDSGEFAVSKYVLTDYGLDHLDECCIVFQREFHSAQGVDLGFYGQCYLSKAIDASRFCRCTEVESEENQSKKEQAKNIKALKEDIKWQIEFLQELPTSFSKTFDKYMKTFKDKKGKKLTNLGMSIIAGLSEKYIRTIRKVENTAGYYSVCALCVALHLPPLLSDDFIRKGCGGYPKTEEGTFDKYLIEHHYTEDLYLINEKLKLAGYHKFGSD